MSDEEVKEELEEIEKQKEKKTDTKEPLISTGFAIAFVVICVILYLGVKNEVCDATGQNCFPKPLIPQWFAWAIVIGMIAYVWFNRPKKSIEYYTRAQQMEILRSEIEDMQYDNKLSLPPEAVFKIEPTFKMQTTGGRYTDDFFNITFMDHRRHEKWKYIAHIDPRIDGRGLIEIFEHKGEFLRNPEARSIRYVYGGYKKATGQFEREQT